MLLSILTPTLNCNNTIDLTLKSVINLESHFCGKIEHLIGDGQSSDGTIEKILQYQESFKWASVDILPGKNIPNTLNTLLSKAKGQSIAILNGDDYYDVNEMVMYLQKIQLSNGIENIFYADINIIEANGDFIGIRKSNFDDICNYMSINHPTMLVPKILFDKYGIFNNEMPYNYDYAWTWSLYRNQVNFIYYQRSVAYIRIGGISERAAHKAAREIMLMKFKFGYIWSATRNYFLFIFKRFVRLIIPNALLRGVIKYYRLIFGTIDLY